MAFTDKEKSAIYSTTVSTEGQEETVDRLFFLSEEEVRRYFAGKSLVCYWFYSHEHAPRRIEICYEPGPWWLRDNGSEPSSVKYLERDGKLFEQDSNADQTGYRPAMWVKCSEAISPHFSWFF